MMTNIDDLINNIFELVTTDEEGIVILVCKVIEVRRLDESLKDRVDTD